MSLIDFNFPVYLASASPRRKELLLQLGINFEVVNVEIDESVHNLEKPGDYVIRVAKQKALSAYKQLNLDSAIVIGGDTSVICDNKIIGKPLDIEHAKRILMMLSGQEHQVMSAVALVSNKTVTVKLNTTVVKFKNLSSDEIEQYIATGEPFGKAGAYAIQGLAASFVESIHGSYSGVMGLPLFELSQMLQSYKK